MPVFEEQVRIFNVPRQPYTVIESDSMIIYRGVSNIMDTNIMFKLPRPTFVYKIGMFGTFEKVEVYVTNANGHIDLVFQDKYRNSYVDIGNFGIPLATHVEVVLHGNSGLRELSVYKSKAGEMTP